ncbi:MAG: hypothetical protein WAV68_00750 [Candidatus Nanogingivalis sp.]
MRGKIILTTLFAGIISIFGINNFASAAPIAGVTTDGSAITIKFNSADVAVVDTNQFSNYAPLFAEFASDLDESKVQIKNIAVENSVEITLEKGSLKADSFEKLDNEGKGNKDGVYRYQFKPTDIRVEFRAVRNADGTYDYSRQLIQILGTKDQHLAEQAIDIKRAEIDEKFELAKNSLKIEDLESAKQFAGALIGATQDTIYWNAIIKTVEAANVAPVVPVVPTIQPAVEKPAEKVAETKKPAISAPNTGFEQTNAIFHILTSGIALAGATYFAIKKA